MCIVDFKNTSTTIMWGGGSYSRLTRINLRYGIERALCHWQNELERCEEFVEYAEHF